MSQMFNENNYGIYPDFFDKTQKNTLNYENFPQEFFSIVAILANDCNYNLNALYIHLNKLYISGCFKEKRNDFMLNLACRLKIFRRKFLFL